MAQQRRILVTGATGKVGAAFIERVLSDPPFADVSLRALCHPPSNFDSLAASACRSGVADTGSMRIFMSGVGLSAAERRQRLHRRAKSGPAAGTAIPSQPTGASAG